MDKVRIRIKTKEELVEEFGENYHNIYPTWVSSMDRFFNKRIKEEELIRSILNAIFNGPEDKSIKLYSNFMFHKDWFKIEFINENPSTIQS